jgi:hypothetical protein
MNECESITRLVSCSWTGFNEAKPTVRYLAITCKPFLISRSYHVLSN